MTISIDSNVLATIWSKTDPLNGVTADALEEARDRAELIVCGFVYAELLAAQRSTELLDRWLRSAAITVDWEMDQDVFRSAGTAFSSYVERRRGVRTKDEPRRMLTDFLIGAHAEVRGYSVMTRDKRIFRAAFPKLPIVRLD